MSLARWWQEQVADRARPDSPLGRLAQGALQVAAVPYGAAVRADRLLHRLGVLPTVRLGVPVISVGNLTMGGTGKTPMVDWVCRFLRDMEGLRPALLLRGYGRPDEDSLVVVHDGRRPRAGVVHAGDEAVLLAHRLGNVPVVACADRARAGALALRRHRAEVLVLDDGFQHHRLRREADVVLVDGTRDLYRLHLTPRGTLREPLSALAEAHLLVVTRWDQGGAGARRLAARLRRDFPGVPLVRVSFVPTGLRPVGDPGPATMPPRGRRAAVLCAVGNPSSVVGTARNLGLRVVMAKFLPDHAAVSSRMVRALEQRAAARGAELIVVTEKDEVKLPPAARRSGRWMVMPVEVRFASAEEEERAREVLRARMAERPEAGLLEGRRA